ncbi:MAG: hypothetical protein PVI03_01275 [Candidatus Thorarchaeota archaeon]
MREKIIGLTALVMFLALVMPSTLAQSTGPTTGPDSDITIVCDEDYYFPDIFGNVDIYCDISNSGIPVKALQVGAVFDDYVGQDVEFLEVNVDGSPITYGVTKLPPQAQMVRSEVLSNQVVTVASGATVELHFKVKVPLGMSGKFDVIYGNPGVDNEYRLDPWINASWQYKKCYNLSGHTKNLTGDMAESPYGYPFNVTINTQSAIGSAKMQADCDDAWLVFNDTDYVKFFTRDCGDTDTELWGAWNFTVGESYDFCVYYGNPTAVNNETTPTDIVFEWQDFEDASAFNWSEWSSRRACQNGGWEVEHGTTNGTNNALGIYNGIMAVKQPSGCSGNTGTYFWRNGTEYTHNLTLTGLYSEGEFRYTEGCGVDYAPHYPVSIVNKPADRGTAGAGIIWDTNNYAYPYNGNSSHYSIAFLSSQDMRWYFMNSSGTVDYLVNTSNYYSTRNFYTISGMEFRENTDGNYNVTIYQDYNQPFGVIQMVNWTPHASRRDWGFLVYDDFETFLSSDSDTNSGLSWGTSKGCSKSGEYASYKYIFARPSQEGEPNAVGGAEIPLDNGTLAIQYVSPTPANGTTTANLTAQINVSSNKTIEWCKLNWGGSNYSMTTDTTYCYIDQVLSGTPTYYDVFVEDFWGYQDVTPQRVITGSDYSALLGVGFPIADFNITLDTYFTGINVSFNSSLPTTDMILMTSMNVKKETGNGTNDIWAKVIFDGAVILEEKIRSVDAIGDEGSTGISPIAYNMTAGPHYIQIDFKRSGNGVVSVDDVDVSMGQLVTLNGGTVYGNVTVGNFTHNDTVVTPAGNFTFFKPTSSSTFMSYKIVVEADNETTVQYQYQNLDNTSQLSPFGGRRVSGVGDVGSMSGGFIDYFPTGNSNMTILSSSSTGANVSVNFTSIIIELTDNYTKTIESFQVTNPNTDNDSSVNITDSWTMLANATKTVQVGDGYFIGFYGYYQSNSGEQTVTHKVNATGASCSSKKERQLTDNTDVGFSYLYYVCDNLTASSTYDFQLWVKAETGKTFDHYDESFAGFEINSFDVSTSNVPPIQGIITNPVNGSEVSTSVNVTWTPWSDTNGNFDDYNVSLINADGSFNSTLSGSTSNEYYVLDVSGYLSGLTLGVDVNGCDTEPLCSNVTVFFTVQNVPDYTAFAGYPATTNFSAEPDLQNVSDPVLANSFGQIAWSGSGYDVAGKNFTADVVISNNFVSLDPTDLATFDTDAVITLEGVTYISTDKYRVLKDGSLCTDCVKLDASPVRFSVTGFSTYTTEMIPAFEQQPILAVIPIVISLALIAYLGIGMLSGSGIDVRKIIVAGIMIFVAIAMIGVMYAV